MGTKVSHYFLLIVYFVLVQELTKGRQKWQKKSLSGQNRT
jgi:hypothetical protein